MDGDDPFRPSQMQAGFNETEHMKCHSLSVKMISLCRSESVKTDENERGEGEVRNASQHHVTAERDRKRQLQISNVCT